MWPTPGIDDHVEATKCRILLIQEIRLILSSATHASLRLTPCPTCLTLPGCEPVNGYAWMRGDRINGIRMIYRISMLPAGSPQPATWQPPLEGRSRREIPEQNLQCH